MMETILQIHMSGTWYSLCISGNKYNTRFHILAQGTRVWISDPYEDILDAIYDGVMKLNDWTQLRRQNEKDKYWDD